jgi:hypothetical protein
MHLPRLIHSQELKISLVHVHLPVVIAITILAI